MSERGGGYQRSTSGLVGAMIVLLLVVLGFVAFRAINRTEVETPAPSVSGSELAQVRAAARDAGLAAPVPTPLPEGWQVTSVTFRPGAEATWHLGVLTDDGRYLGIEERPTSSRSLARQYVDPRAQRGGEVTLGARTWTAWSDDGGDHALTTTVGERALLVGGSAQEEVVRRVAGGLDLP